jgi:prevent-host-death family protein
LREIGIKELKNTASRVIEEVESGERVVVTKRGRPTALILSMEDAEDFVLAYAEEFVEMRREGRREYEEGKSVPLDEI